jgi:ABC-type multidrug transport system fused ATPase/permease subunit
MTINLKTNIKKSLVSIIPAVIFRSINILKENQKRKVFFVVLIQSSLGLLDLAGVAAIGLVGALAVTGVQSKVPGNRVGQVLNLLNLENLSIQKQVAFLGLLAAVLFVVRTILSIILSRKILYFLARCGAEISGNLVEKMLTQPLTKIQMKSSQETLYALTNGVSAITLGLIGSFTNILTDLTLLIIITVGLFIVDPVMALVTILFFIVVAFILYLSMSKRALKLGILNGELSIRGNQKILEVLNSYREALIKNRRSYYANEIRESRIELANITAEYSFMPNISKYVIEASLILGAVLISAIQFILQDASHAVATLGVFMAAGSRLAPAILRIQSSAIQARVSSGSAIPTLDLIDLLFDVETKNDKIYSFTSIHKDFIPQVEIQNLKFTYPGADSATLDQISISISSGELVAITGPSGAGKTTLIDCVIGALISDSGKVTISGKQPLEAISNWPGAIGYVPQDVVILNGTIKENIVFGFGIEEVPEELIYGALRKAHLFDHVSDLQDGVNSYVGDKGTSLSGGQRQRLGIARALVSKPKLLILDEATSSLDGKSEADISDSINEFRGEVTTLIIAHRLSTIRNADKVIYMNKGKIEFVGTFEEVRKNVPEFDNQAKLMGL